MLHSTHQEKNKLSTSTFSKRLQKKISERETCLCVGIDPPLEGLSSFLMKERSRLGPESFLERFGSCLIEASSELVPAVKFQAAYFEAFGSPGFAALESLVKFAKNQNLLTILDAKRGDISSTMAAYGRMAFDELDADALTVTPYMGLDVLEPLWPWLKQDRGVYIVWISSNPSGALVQDPICETLLEVLKEACKKAQASEALGLVLGATKINQLPNHLFKSAEALPLLLPGVGAQGAEVEGRLLTLKNKRAPILIPQSRSLIESALRADSWESFKNEIASKVKTEAFRLKC